MHGCRHSRKGKKTVGRRRQRLLASFLALVYCFARAGAEPPVSPVFDATSFGQPSRLTGPWLAAAGDDDRWARPETDDSQWRVLDPKRSLTAQGFHGAPYIWYRLHLRLRAGTPQPAVFIKGLNKNFVLYANGERIGGEGGMRPSDVDEEHPPRAFTLPKDLLARSDGNLVLAMRVNGGPVGFYDLDPFDEDTQIELMHPDEVSVRQSFEFAHNWGVGWAVAGLSMLIGLCGFVIWWSLRDQPEYLALGVWLLASSLSTAIYYRGHVAGTRSTSALTFLLLLARGTTLVGELEFMRLLLRERRSAPWLVLEAICLLTSLSIPLVNSGALPFTSGAVAIFAQIAITELFVTVMLVRGALHGNRDAPVLLLPVLLWSFTDLYRLAKLSMWAALKVQIPSLPAVHIASYTVQFGALTDVLGLLSLLLILVRRTVRLAQEKADFAKEVAAVEELQALLLARASHPTPGYQVNTVYKPMQEVGGDFFLVQPCEDDNSLVAIVGDVSGKGLQAAMRVSLILGVLRREVMGQPDRVLHTLNQALLDQGELGFTTACCVRLEADGSFRYANAGHLNPYVDGGELTSEGALPLGIDPEACYTVLQGFLQKGQCMTLLSDGVPEARSRAGELFGFERTRNFVRSGPETLAQAAQRFGQEDDITILSLALA